MYTQVVKNGESMESHQSVDMVHPHPLRHLRSSNQLPGLKIKIKWTQLQL